MNDMLDAQHDTWQSRVRTENLPAVTVDDWDDARQYITEYFSEKCPTAITNALRNNTTAGVIITCHFVITRATTEEESLRYIDALRIDRSILHMLYRRYTRDVRAPGHMETFFFQDVADHDTDPSKSISLCSFTMAFRVSKK